METTLLEIKNLNISFNISKNIVNTVDNFSLTLKEKETIGIVGESGSGKTISMLGLTRLLPKQAFVDKGSILFKGRDISNISNKEFYQKISGKKISLEDGIGFCPASFKMRLIFFSCPCCEPALEPRRIQPAFS